MPNGLLWFDNGVLETAQKFSVAAAEMDGAIYEVVESNVEITIQEMRDIVLEGGINSTGHPRVRTGAMIGSIGGNIFTNGRGRVQGDVGFVNGPPRYTPYQELGTTRGGLSEGGIPAMLAFATAQVGLVERMRAEFAEGAWLPRIF